MTRTHSKSEALGLALTLALVAALAASAGCADPTEGQIHSGKTCDYRLPAYHGGPPGIAPLTGVDTTPTGEPELPNACCLDRPFDEFWHIGFYSSSSPEEIEALDNHDFDISGAPRYPWYGATIDDGDREVDYTCNYCPNGLRVLQGTWHAGAPSLYTPAERRYCSELDIVMRIEGNTYERLERDAGTGAVFRHAGYYFCGAFPDQPPLVRWISFVPTETAELYPGDGDAPSKIPRPAPGANRVIDLIPSLSQRINDSAEPSWRAWDRFSLRVMDGWTGPPSKLHTAYSERFCRVGTIFTDFTSCKVDFALFGLDENGTWVGPGLPSPESIYFTCW